MLAPMWRQPAARQNVMVLQKSARAHSARNAQISSGVEGREAVEQLLWFPQTCQRVPGARDVLLDFLQHARRACVELQSISLHRAVAQQLRVNRGEIMPPSATTTKTSAFGLHTVVSVLAKSGIDPLQRCAW